MPQKGKSKSAATPTYGEVAAKQYDTQKHDIGPWVSTVGSTRVSRYRYDYINRALQVQWRNNLNQGYIYLGVPYEEFRSFARLASKGRGVNSHLNNFEYRPMTDDEVGAPSNMNRSAGISRARD